MSERTPTPKLVMGHIEIFANGKISVPDNDAVIHIEGDEDSEIEVLCPDALRLAAFIVKAVNAHDALVKALEKIIEMNRQHAKDQYGDADKAESWACITVARKAIASIKERA